MLFRSAAEASVSPDPRHDHAVVSARLAVGLVSNLPGLVDMRRPVRLRMGAFVERLEVWANVVEERGSPAVRLATT